ILIPKSNKITVFILFSLLVKVTLEIKFEGNDFDNATNGTTPEGKRLRNILSDLLKLILKNILRITIIEVKKANSVIVKYELVVNATSREEAQEVINAIQDQVNTGMIGNYTVDPNYPVGAKITMIVDGKPVTQAPPNKESDSETLIILLGVGVFLLVLVIILLIFLIVKLRK
ncbi:uncharacterized protein LOC116303961, partial [Actinia tenebrosa]|uniref:Uncharacterized protein LOC116303961 n=1 Tax=Actinia tenebrosa TaxID=6105 RepID=A0A6P8ITE6_ACTTE